jgi:hypothetical protein
MDWFPVDVKLTTGPEWLRLDPALRGHWLALVSFCAMRENGGRIEGARWWTRTDWIRAAGVYQATIDRLVAEGLSRWEDDGALVLVHYPAENDALVRKRRAAGVKGAESRWRIDADAIGKRNGTASGTRIAGGSSNPIAGATCREEESREEKIRSPLTPRAVTRPPLLGSEPMTAVDLIGGYKAIQDGFNRLFADHCDGDRPTWTDETRRKAHELLAGGHSVAEVLRRARIMFESPPSFLTGTNPAFDTLHKFFDRLRTEHRPAAVNGARRGVSAAEMVERTRQALEAERLAREEHKS